MGRTLLKVERLARNNFKIVYWNCWSLSVSDRTADMLARIRRYNQEIKEDKVLPEVEEND